MRLLQIPVAMMIALSFAQPILAQEKTPGQKQTCEPAVRSTLERLYAAWSELNPEKAAPFYDKDPKLLFFDVAPLKYTGWSEYAAGVPKAFAPYNSAVFRLNDDLQVHCHGDLAWAAATWHGDLTKKDGSKDHMDGRYTAVLTKQRNQWLVMHEQMSLPAPGQ